MVIRIFYIPLLAILVFACNASRQAQKHYETAKEKHLPTVALLSSIDWPCGVSKRDTLTRYLPGKRDTITVPQIITVDCPDTARNAKPGATIKVPVKVPCNCESTTDTIVRYITEFEKDPRDSIFYNDRIKDVTKDLVKAEQGRNTWRVISFVFMGIFLAAMVLIFWKFKII